MLWIAGGCLYGQVADSRVKSQPLSADHVFYQEYAFVDELVEFALLGDEASLRQKFEQKPDSRLRRQKSAVMARRLAMACGNLRNLDEYGAAIYLARLGLAHLATMKGSSAESRAEKLYWEIWLTGEVLQDWRQAADLLDQAKRLPSKARQTRQLERLERVFNQHLKGVRG